MSVCVSEKPVSESAFDGVFRLYLCYDSLQRIPDTAVYFRISPEFSADTCTLVSGGTAGSDGRSNGQYPKRKFQAVSVLHSGCYRMLSDFFFRKSGTSDCLL